ncbi:MAG: hypothetical protein JXP34_00240 [Planctomycetes bacterium]|nr:hypothetical protein [Planctomycetota bacterium]
MGRGCTGRVSGLATHGAAGALSLLALLALARPGLRAAPGDLVLAAPLSDSGVDVAVDPDGQRIWLLNETSGQVTILGPAYTAVGAIPHPFGPALFPFLIPRTRGLARAPDRGTLFVLNATDVKIQEFSVSGEPRNQPIPLVLPEGAGASLWSLAYDQAAGTLWTLDEIADLLIEINPNTGQTVRTLHVPGDDPPEMLLRGRGVEIATEAGTPRLLVTYGTVFDDREALVRFLDLDGRPTGRDVPLDSVGAGTITGFGWWAANGLERVLVLANPSAMSGTLYVLDAAAPALLPPTDLRCTATLDGRTVLSWVNHGPLAGGGYDEIIVRRSDVIIDTIDGSRTEWMARTAEGPATYGVQGNNRFILSPLSRCSLRAGEGGIVRWCPFPGVQASGIAHDAATGAIWVGDAAGDRIHRFDRLLAHEGSIPSPFPEGAGPIVFLPEAAGGEPCLVVASTEIPAIVRISLDGQPFEAPRITDLGGPEATILGLAPAPGGYVLALAGPDPRVVELTPEGRLVRACEPSLFGGIVIAGGLASGSEPSFVFAATTGGSLAEISIGPETCAGTGRFIHAGIQGNAAGGDRIRSLVRGGDVFFVTGGATNAIYEVILRTVPAAFVRGDANDDLRIDVADGMALAMHLFRNGAPPPCAEAADANDDGWLDISDPIFIIWYLFAGGAPPPPPFPAAGEDPGGPGGLGCTR